jgi:hypothetical protein
MAVSYKGMLAIVDTNRHTIGFLMITDLANSRRNQVWILCPSG